MDGQSISKHVEWIDIAEKVVYTGVIDAYFNYK